MKRHFLIASFALFLTVTAVSVVRSEERLLPDLEEIYWATDSQNDNGIVSDSGQYQYDEAAAAEDEFLPLPEAIPYPHMTTGQRPVIAIVIDDMGVDHKRSAHAIDDLPAAVTLSFLPYSLKIAEQAADAKAKGHELILHMPMQPDRHSADPGPNYLGTEMTSAEIHDRVIKNLDGFKGYDGVNNHMGSKFTRDRKGLEIVMAELKDRKLMFLDSKTTPDSIAESIAREYGLQTTHRDVFLDNDENAAAVAKYLKHVETFAQHAGSAVAIGHPKDVTINGLKKWLPTLKEKGFDLVPLSQLIEMRQQKFTLQDKQSGAKTAPLTYNIYQ